MEEFLSEKIKRSHIQDGLLLENMQGGKSNMI